MKSKASCHNACGQAGGSPGRSFWGFAFLLLVASAHRLYTGACDYTIYNLFTTKRPLLELEIWELANCKWNCKIEVYSLKFCKSINHDITWFFFFWGGGFKTDTFIQKYHLSSRLCLQSMFNQLSPPVPFIFKASDGRKLRKSSIYRSCLRCGKTSSCYLTWLRPKTTAMHSCSSKSSSAASLIYL